MTIIAQPKSSSWWIEHLLGGFVVIGLAWVMGYLYFNGYLPLPFFYESQDTFMDWFNPAYLAHNPGAYDSWGSIYPPLTFVILKFATNPICYPFAEQYASRDCDVYGIVCIHLIFIANIVLIAKTLLIIDRRTALPRSIALAAGMPMLFALERGNIVILCFTCVLLAYGSVVRSARWKWFFAACAINFKVYLVGTLFAQLIRRRWRWFEGASLSTLLVYLVTFAVMGAGTPQQLYFNIKAFSESLQAGTLLDLAYAETYQPLRTLLRGDTFPILTQVDSTSVEVLTIAVPLLMTIAVILVFLAAAAAAVRPQVVTTGRVVFLSIAAALVMSEAGGYTQIFLLLFVFMERWQGFGRIWAIVVAYILCIPGDIPLFALPPLPRQSFLAGHEVIAEYFVGVGPFVRPGLVLSIVIALSLVTLRQVWNQLRIDRTDQHPLRAVSTRTSPDPTG